MDGIERRERPPRILLTGPPGVGKTTVILRLLEKLGGRVRAAGFTTSEIREGRARRGFRATAVAGSSIVFSRRDLRGAPMVGSYGVDVVAFEDLVLPEFSRPADLLVIDEIGKMECLSPRFVRAVRDAFERPVPIVATVALRGSGLIAEVKLRPDVAVEEVTRANRDALPAEVAARLGFRD
ncbi:MAG: nucleoside-triphosphatase [Planctomycetota bacterium]